MAKKYQRSNQNRKQKDKTTQWPKDTNEVIKNRKQKDKTTQWPKDTNEVIKNRKQKDKQHNGQ
jgi:hypothetical protein